MNGVCLLQYGLNCFLKQQPNTSSKKIKKTFQHLNIYDHQFGLIYTFLTQFIKQFIPYMLKKQPTQSSLKKPKE